MDKGEFLKTKRNRNKKDSKQRALFVNDKDKIDSNLKVWDVTDLI